MREEHRVKIRQLEYRKSKVEEQIAELDKVVTKLKAEASQLRQVCLLCLLALFACLFTDQKID